MLDSCVAVMIDAIRTRRTADWRSPSVRIAAMLRSCAASAAAPLTVIPDGAGASPGCRAVSAAAAVARAADGLCAIVSPAAAFADCFADSPFPKYQPVQVPSLVGKAFPCR